MTPEIPIADFDRQELNDILITAQTKQLDEYRHENQILIRNLDVLRGELQTAQNDRDQMAFHLVESERFSTELSRRCDQTNDDAYRYLNEAVDLCCVLRDTFPNGPNVTGALTYLAGIIRFYREKFHAPTYGDDIPF